MRSCTFHLHQVSVELLPLVDLYPHIKYFTKIKQGFQMFFLLFIVYNVRATDGTIWEFILHQHNVSQ